MTEKCEKSAHTSGGPCHLHPTVLAVGSVTEDVYNFLEVFLSNFKTTIGSVEPEKPQEVQSLEEDNILTGKSNNSSNNLIVGHLPLFFLISDQF